MTAVRVTCSPSTVLCMFPSRTSMRDFQNAVAITDSALIITLSCQSIYLIYESDVWLTVHHNSVWIRKTN